MMAEIMPTLSALTMCLSRVMAHLLSVCPHKKNSLKNKVPMETDSISTSNYVAASRVPCHSSAHPRSSFRNGLSRSFLGVWCWSGGLVVWCFVLVLASYLQCVPSSKAPHRVCRMHLPPNWLCSPSFRSCSFLLFVCLVSSPLMTPHLRKLLLLAV